jgi:hypothetical protein
VNVDRVRDMLKNTTQWDRVKARYPMHRHFRSRFLAANVFRLNETVAMDTILKALWKRANDGSAEIVDLSSPGKSIAWRSTKQPCQFLFQCPIALIYNSVHNLLDVVIPHTLC